MIVQRSYVKIIAETKPVDAGAVVIPCKWEEAMPFSVGVAKVKDTNGELWKISTTGKVVGKVL